MPENKNAREHVHPTIAWAAILGCALVGGLTASMLYAQAAESPSTAKPYATPEVSACRQACYTAYGECTKAAGGDQDALARCKSAGGECVNACAPATGKPAAETPRPKLSECAMACYSTRNECAKAAGDGSVALHQCNVTAMACMSACPKVEGTDGAEDAYKAAVQAARQRYLDGQKKLLDEFQANMERALKAYLLSKNASGTGQK